jgi:hypothetical protein
MTRLYSKKNAVLRRMTSSWINHMLLVDDPLYHPLLQVVVPSGGTDNDLDYQEMSRH